MIDHPTDDATAAVALMLFGGPPLFLLAQAWYLRLVLGKAPYAQLATVIALAIVSAAALAASALVVAAAVVAVLVGLVAIDSAKGTEQPVKAAPAP